MKKKYKNKYRFKINKDFNNDKIKIYYTLVKGF